LQLLITAENIVPATKRSKEEDSPISAEKIVAAANSSREDFCSRLYQQRRLLQPPTEAEKIAAVANGSREECSSR
jgi:hypothetical protein